jgi:hypothetical protein
MGALRLKIDRYLNGRFLSFAARKRTFGFPPSGDMEILIRVSLESVSYGNFWPTPDGPVMEITQR